MAKKNLTEPSLDFTSGILHLRRLGIDTHQEPVVYLHRESEVCRSEGFAAQSRVLITTKSRRIIATLNIVHDQIISKGEAGLSEAAWSLLDAREGEPAKFSHPEPVESLSHVRAKMYGHPFEEEHLGHIIQDIHGGRYADVHLASFITVCGGDQLSLEEINSLTEAMVAVGDKLNWSQTPVVDKHSVGGLPGNRTTLIIVPILTAFGLTMPKTSSRGITSPAGTADTMETLAPIRLTLGEMRKVVAQEGGCIVWGGGVHLSPTDDTLIRVERALEIDSEGQMAASVLSKKIAAGSTHVLLDIPVGPTAKVRSQAAADKLVGILETVGKRQGLVLRALTTDGSQPVGRGIGPALEARDVLAVLRDEAGAPEDLRFRALQLAGALLELSGRVEPGQGVQQARSILKSGQAWKKFQAIARAQGGLREAGEAPFTQEIPSPRAGKVSGMNNRKLSRLAKLAGAPEDKTAGIYLKVKLGDPVEAGQALMVLHAESKGELAYALNYLALHEDIITVEAPL
ncbi:MAG: thymidine phosphorylase family protein [bacterium]|nr:thymidine phosphorylase family protein [bacterium]